MWVVIYQFAIAIYLLGGFAWFVCCVKRDGELSFGMLVFGLPLCLALGSIIAASYLYNDDGLQRAFHRVWEFKIYSAKGWFKK